jgi:hypothetical protein
MSDYINWDALKAEITKAFMRAEVTKWSEVAEKTDIEWLKLRNVGTHTVKGIHEELRSRGYGQVNHSGEWVKESESPSVDLPVSLRDYFAAHALSNTIVEEIFYVNSEQSADKVAEYAYEIADAMMKEREQS